MDILSDVSVKGNLETLGEMKVSGGSLSVNKFDAGLIISGCSDNTSDNTSFKIGVERAGVGQKYLYINRNSIDFWQNINFYQSTGFYDPVILANSVRVDGAIEFCMNSYFWNPIMFMGGDRCHISINGEYDTNLGSYLVIDSLTSGPKVYIKDTFYKKDTSSGKFFRIDNKVDLNVPENCTKFYISNGIRWTEFLPVINSYEVASEGCLKKVDMDIFLTDGSIIGERVSTEPKRYFFSFYIV